MSYSEFFKTQLIGTEIPLNEFLTYNESSESPKCPICYGTGYFTYGGSFGGNGYVSKCFCMNNHTK